jgi:hypothetical protein
VALELDALENERLVNFSVATLFERLGSGDGEGKREHQGGQKGLGVQRRLLLDNRSSGFAPIRENRASDLLANSDLFGSVSARYGLKTRGEN